MYPIYTSNPLGAFTVGSPTTPTNSSGLVTNHANHASANAIYTSQPASVSGGHHSNVIVNFGAQPMQLNASGQSTAQSSNTNATFQVNDACITGIHPVQGSQFYHSQQGAEEGIAAIQSSPYQLQNNGTHQYTTNSSGFLSTGYTAANPTSTSSPSVIATSQDSLNSSGNLITGLQQKQQQSQKMQTQQLSSSQWSTPTTSPNFTLTGTNPASAFTATHLHASQQAYPQQPIFVTTLPQNVAVNSAEEAHRHSNNTMQFQIINPTSFGVPPSQHSIRDGNIAMTEFATPNVLQVYSNLYNPLQAQSITFDPNAINSLGMQRIVSAMPQVTHQVFPGESFSSDPQIHTLYRGSGRNGRKHMEMGSNQRNTSGAPDDHVTSGPRHGRGNAVRNAAGVTSAAANVPYSPLMVKFRSGEHHPTLREISPFADEFVRNQEGSRYIQSELLGRRVPATNNAQQVREPQAHDAEEPQMDLKPGTTARLRDENGTYETVSTDEDRLIFIDAILPLFDSLVGNVFANYVLQVVIEYAADHPDLQRRVVQCFRGNVVRYTVQLYGSRLIQKCIDHFSEENQDILMEELHKDVYRCSVDPNGNHVIQKWIERHPKRCGFIVAQVLGNVGELCRHACARRIIEALLENCPQEQRRDVFAEFLQVAPFLANDPHGNYVIQHLLAKGMPWQSEAIIETLMPNFLNFSTMKFASNVVEKMYAYANRTQRTKIIDLLMEPVHHGCSGVLSMMRDQYANYVIQKIIDLSEEDLRTRVVEHIRPHVHTLRKFTYGKHIIARLEKCSLLSSGPRQTNTTGTSPQTSHG